MYKILIVDDDYAIRLLYQEELTEEGYNVISTSDANGLLDMIAQQRPDLVVLDIEMKEINGLDLLQEIRNSNQNLPIILCTAYPNFRWDSKSAAADAFMVKSSDLSELRLCVRTSIEGNAGFLKAAKTEKGITGYSHPAI